MRETAEARALIVRIGAWLYERGMIVAGDGNISTRLNDRTILCTPAGLCKGMMAPEQLIRVDLDGMLVEGNLKPSSELKMHLEVYRRRGDVRAVVHAHPPISTGFACAGLALDRAILSEMILTLGTVPVAPYGTPSTEEVPAGIRELIGDHDGILLANHGVLAVGPDLMTAFHRMEIIEHTAKISLVARMLGRERLLTADKVEALYRVVEQGGGNVRALAAGKRPLSAEEAPQEAGSQMELAGLLTRLVEMLNGR